MQTDDDVTGLLLGLVTKPAPPFWTSNLHVFVGYKQLPASVLYFGVLLYQRGFF